MRIRTKLIAVFLTTVIVAFGSVLWIVSSSMRDAAARAFEENSHQQLLRINDTIAQFFMMNMQLAHYLGNSPLLPKAYGLLPDYTDSKQPRRFSRQEMTPEAQAVDLFFESVLKSYSELAGIFVGFKDGGFLEFPLNTWPAGHDPRKRPWYAPTVNGSESSRLGKSYLTAQGMPVCGVNFKVRSASGEVLGVLGIDIPLKGLVQKASEIRIGTAGYMMLIEDTGLILADPKHPELASRNLNDGSIPALKNVMNMKDGTFQATIDGRETMVTVLTGFSNWKVLAIIDVAEVDAPTNTLIRRIFMVGGVILLILILVSLWLARSICVPLGIVVDTANKIATGETKSLSHDSSFSGEMLEMHSALVRMVSNLNAHIQTAVAKGLEAEQQTEKARKALEEAENARQAAENARREGILAAAAHLESSAKIISAASGGLEKGVTQSEQGAVRQADRISETATAMEEMNCTVLEVARNAGAAADVTASARAKAEDGAKLVSTMVKGMRQVEENSLTLKKGMGELGQHAQSISQIMGVISDIADQTNLLALNAAIEAARAGEAGRGFAVVADEVRKLAEKTQASTSDVSNAIKAIQQSAESSIRQVDTTTANITEVTVLAATAGSSLVEIVSMVESAADQVRTIATAAEEQSASSEEINRSISEVNAIATSNAEIMKKAALDVAELSEQARVLDTLINDMKK